MSLNDVSMFHVLGEDQAHRTFIRAWLRASDVHPRCVNTDSPPAGKGGGCRFVLSRCGEMVRSAQRRKARTRVIIAIDADEGTVDAREVEIQHELDKCAADGGDILCLLIPRRHIETWVEALTPDRPAVNEQDDYKDKSTQDLKNAARRLAHLTSAPAAPPSLVVGYERLRKLRGL